jgi:2-polyprenyl-3-methyl-5-hydroxy-6-metoxy-1,4-benzoquinol methylase
MQQLEPQKLSAHTSELEYPHCPLCFSQDREIRYSQFDKYKIVRCSDCGVHYLYPRLSEDAMNRAYANDRYFDQGESGYSDVSYSMQEKALRATFRRLLFNMQNRCLTGGSLLEVGCGYGFLLDEAKHFFEYRVGTEFSKAGVEIAASRAENVYRGGIEQIPRRWQFDCVVATHVIEHVYRPLEFIKSLTAHVKPNGIVLLAAPDMNGLLRKTMGRRWPSFKTPEHVLYFDANTLSALMSQAGLVNLRTMPYPHAFPLALIVSKFRLPCPPILGNTNIWVPATTVAVHGTISE